MPHKIDLHGLNILVTRTRPQGAELCQEIEAAGGHAIFFPAIEIVPFLPGYFQQQLDVLDQQDWLIFVSQHAVAESFKAIHAQWPVFPANIKVAAVGEGTARALKAANLPVDIFPADNWSSEGLLELPDFQNIKNKKILLIKGEGGRDYLAQALAMRKAVVSEMLVYRREIPSVNIDEHLFLLKQNKINCIVCASGDGLRNLKKLFKSAWKLLQKLPIVVISPRMKLLAQELGFQQILLARNAEHNAIIEVIAPVFFPKG